MKYLFFFAFAFCLFGFKPSNKLKLPKSYKFIPSGSFQTADGAKTINAFYMLNHEVTNLEYKEFLYDLKKQGKDSLYQACYPDTLGWQQAGGYTTPLVKHYFSHPAYHNYPVVNVSAYGMEQFCKWLTGKLQIMYGNQINEARLPSEDEWKYAAKGGLQLADYPWGGPYVQNAEGEYLANFQIIGDHNLTAGENGPIVLSDSTYRPDLSIVDNAFFTAVAESYTPNGYGLYNMSGNVAEYTSDGKARGGHWRSYGGDIRINSEITFEKPNSYVGFRPVITYLSK